MKADKNIDLAMRSHTNLNVFSSVTALLENSLYGGSPTADKSAQRIIAICKQEQQRQLKRMNARFIAAANPATILALLERLQAAEDAAKDAERYRWLRDARADHKRMAMFSDFPHLWTCTDEMDAAVDAARRLTP